MPAVTLDTTLTYSRDGRAVRRLTPAVVGAIGANANMLTSAYTPTFDVGDLEIQFSPAAVCKFQVIITPPVGAAQTVLAQNGDDLVANAGYTWVLPVSVGSSYQFQVTSAINVNLFGLKEFENTAG